MLPFKISFVKGEPVYEQLVYGVKKAFLAGQLKPGEPFPSVRQLSGELGINPNTVQKAVAALQDEGLLRSVPGIGTVVAEAPPATRAQRQELLGRDVERVVVAAKKLSVDLGELQQAIAQHWRRFSRP